MSLVSNGLLIPLVILLMFRGQSLPEETQAQSSSAFAPQDSSSLTYVTRTASELGVRHRWTYEQWVEQLGREARALSDQPSSHLAILAGDSLSLWFPPELLPPKQIWLNQGISGETSTGLLKRLKLFDNTDPEVIFVMIGVNDLIRGIKANEVLSNYQKIIQELRWVHPETKIVVQSILPHSGASATWEGRDRLLAIPNSDIQALNQELSKIAQREGVLYLNLYPLFADRAGNLRPEFSTDGLHLNDSGYLIWSASLQLFS
ncbi:MAG: G-D-S-L family lipolytic protein, partial [Oscillatoriales cyanobacterium RM1_1_9]|nr:G-D-S-L family lipolytic protein [Oscillatoriales cyanobacterium RM1_1_9]